MYQTFQMLCTNMQTPTSSNLDLQITNKVLGIAVFRLYYVKLFLHMIKPWHTL